MPQRIPEEVIERLKREASVEKLARARGIELKKHGADLIGRCPFHDDKTPSLVITPAKNLWHCLGACNAGGTAIDWVMRSEGVSFRHAVELLRTQNAELRMQNGRAEGPQTMVKRSTVSKLAPPVDRSADDKQLLLQVVNFYHETLKQSPEALAYLQKRGLQHPEMLDKFKLGFANRTLGYRLPHSNRVAGNELRSRLQKLGVMRESGHEHFNGCIVIPIFSSSGEVTQMYGRKIIDPTRDSQPPHLYLPGPHRGVFNEDSVRAAQEVILCESLIDALTFWCAGVRNVTASYGVNGFTEEHHQILQGKHVHIAYDRDEAGDKAAEQLKEKLPRTTRVLFPQGMDANEYAQERPLAPLVGPAARGQTPVTSDREYRWRGRNLLVTLGEKMHADALDIYSAKQRAAFAKLAAIELGVEEEAIKRDLGRLLLEMETQPATPEPPKPMMDEREREEALALLKEPRLLQRVVNDFERCGIVGEETNKMIGYLAAVSRRLEAPLAVVVQSSSAAGKSSLMDAVLAFVPEEDRIEYSAMTGQSLYYMGETDLKHKVLAIAEESGASRAAYALKLLQSEGVLSIASTGKDPATGKLVTHRYRVEGPVMIFLTTTAIDLDEELLNRCLVLTVDEDRAQTQAIHRLQREQQTVEGLIRRQERKRLCRLHQNAQRLLKPLFVANPHAPELTFPDHRTRLRRDHTKYLTLIRAIALLHQHQRPLKSTQGVDYIEVTREDIAMADKLMQDLLGRSLDELPPQTRKLLSLIETFTPRFTRKELREFTGWGATQIRIHLDRLVDLEYLLVHSEGHGRYVYELQVAGSPVQVAGPLRPGGGGGAGRLAVSSEPITTGMGMHYAAAEA
jgi:DNA primase catalytic core